MASRYAKSPHFDYCFHPIHVIDGDKDIVVPCGKCNGCLLHKANSWSVRVSDEIEACPFPYFFTLTYNNYYLPVLVNRNGLWLSDHENNLRHTLDKNFNSKDVLRRDGIVIDEGYSDSSISSMFDSDLMDFSSSYGAVPVTNYGSDNVIPYASKRDVQLFLKLVRSCIDKDFSYLDYESKRFRYFIISEYGETRFRPHFHGVLFFKNKEVAEAFSKRYVYTCWQMCSPIRHEHDHFCDSGAAGYITNYLTCNTLLPKVYQEVKELRPFRLASKSPAIGYLQFDKEKVCKDLSDGVTEYSKSVERIGAKYVFRFPASFVSSFFKKCYRYNRLDFQGLYEFYRMVFVQISELRRNSDYCNHCSEGQRYSCAVARLREVWDSSRLYPALVAYKVCKSFSWSVFHYVHVMDFFYYKKDMNALRYFYEYQQKLADDGKFYDIACMYGNLWECLSWSNAAVYSKMMACYYFLEGLKLYAHDFDSYDKRLVIPCHVDSSTYQLEVDEILKNMVKSPKVNEFLGIAPQCYTD